MLDKRWIILLIISYMVTDEAFADGISTRICSGKVCISEEYSKTFHTELPPVIEVGKSILIQLKRDNKFYLTIHLMDMKGIKSSFYVWPSMGKSYSH